jgi:hypothetical protein
MGMGIIEYAYREGRYFTDPSAVLSILKLESEGFNEFVGARDCEMKVNSNMEKGCTG